MGMTEQIVESPDDEVVRRVLATYPHLKERAAFDLVSSLAVAGDLVQCRREPRTLTKRILNGLTGRSEQEINLIQANLTVGLSVAVDWLKDLQVAGIRSDLALAEVIHVTCDMRVQLEATAQSASETGAKVAKLERETAEHFGEINGRVAYLEAVQEVEEAFRRHTAVLSGHQRPWVGWLLMLDALFWSPFGAFVRTTNQNEAAASKALNYLFERMSAAVSDSIGKPPNMLLGVEEYETGPAVRDRDVLEYVLQSGVPQVRSLSYRLAAALPDWPNDAAAKSAVERHAPRALTPRAFAFRMIKENVTSYAPGFGAWRFERGS